MKVLWHLVPKPKPKPKPRTLGTTIRVLTIAFDDSTHFVATAFRQLATQDPSVRCYSALLQTQSNVDFISRTSCDITGAHGYIYNTNYLLNFDAIFIAKVPPEFAAFIVSSRFLDLPERPLLLGAFPGLEFSPWKGFRNRLLFDVIYFNTQSDKQVFQRVYPQAGSSKTMLVGNPSVLLRYSERNQSRPVSSEGTAFLSQNITPLRLESRVALLKKLSAQQEIEPLSIKSRQMQGENQGHVHQERFPFEALSKIEALPISFSYCSMTDALLSFEQFISCSSTGVMEAAAQGKRVGFVSTFDGWDDDPLHIANLGYSTRYDFGIELESMTPLALRAAPAEFLFDFGLSGPTVSPPVRTVLEQSLSRQPGNTMSLWKTSQGISVTPLNVAQAYAHHGNPHKAFYLTLSCSVSSPLSRSQFALANECYEQLKRKHGDSMLLPTTLLRKATRHASA